MRKIFTFLFAALMSVGMYATTVVTITDSDFPASEKSFTKDGVTVSAYAIDGMQGNISGPGSFSTTLGNFTKIEVSAASISVSGEGWSGNFEHQTWTGNASSVSFTGSINGYEEGTTLKFTIEVPIDYYVVSSKNGWQADAAYKLAANTQGAPGEYVVYDLEFAKDDSIKVIATDGQNATWYPDKAPNYVVAKDGTYNIYFRPDGQGDNDWYYKYFYVAEVVDETYISVAFPSANRPQYISVGGTFSGGNGQWGMRIFNEPWFVCDEDLYTGKGDVLKFHDSNNKNYVLCKKNGENWEQLLLYCKDYAVVSFKNQPTRVIEELDFSDANTYAWKEGMPEPATGMESIQTSDVRSQKIIRNGQLLIIRDGKTYNAQGAQVR